MTEKINPNESWKSIFTEPHLIKTFYPKGSLIYMEGSPLQGLHFIESGKVKLCRSEEDGKTIILRFAQAGEIIGLSCLFSHNQYGSSAHALEDSTITFLDKQSVHRLLLEIPSLSEAFLRAIARELKEADRRTSSLIRKSAGERLANFILSFQTDSPDIDLPLSREEIAAFVGTTSETVTRYITSFKKKGFLREEDRRYSILQPEKLSLYRN